MGHWRHLRGTDLLEDSNTETRSLPAPEKQLPLTGLRTIWSGASYWKLRPVAALAIADLWAAVRVLADAVSSLPLLERSRGFSAPAHVVAGSVQRPPACSISKVAASSAAAGV